MINFYLLHSSPSTRYQHNNLQARRRNYPPNHGVPLLEDLDPPRRRPVLQLRWVYGCTGEAAVATCRHRSLTPSEARAVTHHCSSVHSLHQVLGLCARPSSKWMTAFPWVSALVGRPCSRASPHGGPRHVNQSWLSSWRRGLMWQPAADAKQVTKAIWAQLGPVKL